MLMRRRKAWKNSPNTFGRYCKRIVVSGKGLLITFRKQKKFDVVWMRAMVFCQHYFFYEKVENWIKAIAKLRHKKVSNHLIRSLFPGRQRKFIPTGISPYIFDKHNHRPLALIGWPINAYPHNPVSSLFYRSGYSRLSFHFWSHHIIFRHTLVYPNNLDSSLRGLGWFYLFFGENWKCYLIDSRCCCFGIGLKIF